MDFGGNCCVGPAPQGPGSVAEDFPRVLSYGDRTSGALLLGSTSPATEVTLNDKAYAVGLKTAPKVTTHRAAYTPASRPRSPGSTPTSPDGVGQRVQTGRRHLRSPRPPEASAGVPSGRPATTVCRARSRASARCSRSRSRRTAP
ncbi:hypothetical protein ACFRLW_29740 [Streptomyces sp. NPDC056728]